MRFTCRDRNRHMESRVDFEFVSNREEYHLNSMKTTISNFENFDSNFDFGKELLASEVTWAGLR